MANFATTLFLGDLTNSLGWSETYYRIAADHDEALANGALLVTARVGILLDVYQVRGFRVSDFAVPGDSRISTVVTPGDIDAAVRKPSDPWTALNLRLEAGGNRRGRKFLHGIPQDFFKAGREYDATNASNADLITFMTHLTANYQLKFKAAAGPPIVYGFQAFTNANPVGQTKHEIGRPFGLLVGRR